MITTYPNNHKYNISVANLVSPIGSMKLYIQVKSRTIVFWNDEID